MFKELDTVQLKQQSQPHEKKLQQLISATPNLIYLRDGEVVLYKRSSTPIYQCRYKLEGKGWVRVSTHKASLENAVAVACDLYDEARYRQKLGLAHTTQNFTHIAQATLKELRQQIDMGKGKTAFHSYVSCIEKYFIPYFAEKYLEQLTHNDITEFELWRNRQMGKLPKASTLNNFSSAWNRLLATAVNKGWISERAPIPKLNGGGLKSQARPAFSREEIDHLLGYMVAWAESGRLAVEREMRPLLRDYVEMLLLTGMRHGTEALGIDWRNIEWHTHEGKKYLRLWVSGKTGGRWLIAKHRAVDVLRRLHNRQNDIKHISFDELLKTRAPHKLFRFSNGYQPPSLNGTFRRLMRDSGLEKNSEGQTRTLYSLRHTYATLELLENGTDIHTLAKQMGNSALMIERHYSKLTATMAADKLA
jgi:integrase